MTEIHVSTSPCPFYLITAGTYIHVPNSTTTLVQLCNYVLWIITYRVSKGYQDHKVYVEIQEMSSMAYLECQEIREI
jgi:hypothetical protein